MTSSFGTVVGTPRDKLPNISETNYDRVTPDLSKAVNEQIDKNIVDTKDFFGDMMKIAQLRYDNRDDNLSALASLTKAGAEYKKVSEEAAKLAEIYQKNNKKYTDIKEAAKEQELQKKEDEKDRVVAKTAANLIAEDTTESSDLAFVVTKKPEEEATIQGQYSIENLNFGSINQGMIKADAYNKTSLEANTTWDQLEENLGIAILLDARKNGIDTNGRKWNQHYIKKIIPELNKLKEKWFIDHDRYKKSIVVSNLADQKKTKISEYLDDPNTNTEDLLNYIIDTNGGKESGFTRADALNDLGTIVFNSLRAGDGRFTIQQAQTLKNELKFLDATKSTKGKEVYTTLSESKFGKNGAVTSSVVSMLNRGIDFASRDPKDIEKAKINRFKTEVVPNFQEEDGSFTAEGTLGLMSEWSKEFGSLPMDQSILSANTKLSTGNSFGSNYGKYSVPGESDKLLGYKTDFTTDYLKQYNVDNSGGGVTYTRNNLPQPSVAEIEAAYGAFKNNLNQAVSGDQGLDENQRLQNEYNAIRDKLLKGEYKTVVPDFNTGQPQDVANDASKFVKDKSLINSNVPVSAIEKNALETSRAAIDRGDWSSAITPYWKNVSNKIGDTTPADFLLNRLKATGGMKDGQVVDKGIYDLDKEDYYELHRNSNAHSSIKVFYGGTNKEGKSNAEIMLNSLRVKDKDGEFISDGDYIRRYGRASSKAGTDGDTLTLREHINQGSDQVGRYKIPYTILKQLSTYGPEGKPILGSIMDKPFTEDSQSIVASLAWHMQLEKMNATRGVAFSDDQKKILFPYTHSTLTIDEQNILNEFMPNLAEAPYFLKPNTIMSDVMSTIVSPNEAAQNKEYEDKIPFDKFMEFTKSKGLGTNILNYNQLTNKDQKELLKFVKLKTKKSDFGFSLIPIDTPKEKKQKKQTPYKKRTRR